MLHLIDPVDDWLERRVAREMKKGGLRLLRHDTPMFLTSEVELREYFAGRRMFMASFYAQRRKRLDILMQDGQPVGAAMELRYAEPEEAAARHRVAAALAPGRERIRAAKRQSTCK